MASSQQETPEAKQATVTNRIKEAVNCGLKVLEEAFERLEAPSTREGAAAEGGGGRECEAKVLTM